MAAGTSLATGRTYGVRRACATWAVTRSSFYDGARRCSSPRDLPADVARNRRSATRTCSPPFAERAPGKPRPDETIRALARAHRWKRLLEDGKYRSAGELAEADGVTRSFVNRLLRLTLLAPDIVEAILEGRQPKAVQLEELTDAMPSGWEEQRQQLPER